MMVSIFSWPEDNTNRLYSGLTLLLLVLLIVAGLSGCQSAAGNAPDSNSASTSLDEGESASAPAGEVQADLPAEEDQEISSQCLYFAGDLLVENAEFGGSPCAAYQHCPDPSIEVTDAMGEGDPVEGQGDCSQAPGYCFDEAEITHLVDYMQPGYALPFGFSLEDVGGNFQAQLNLDRNDDNASMVLVYMYNDAGVNNEDFQTALDEGSLELHIPYGLGAMTLNGNLGEKEGSGIFNFSHPDVGEFVVGSWTVTCQE